MAISAVRCDDVVFGCGVGWWLYSVVFTASAVWDCVMGCGVVFECCHGLFLGVSECAVVSVVSWCVCGVAVSVLLRVLFGVLWRLR